MISKYIILGFSFGYLALLFLIAYFGERRAKSGKSIVNNPYIYALSMAVYCTAWTYYGSVGRASVNGIEFLAIYIGPTILAPLWYLVIRKIIRISKVQRISNLADFISARYGKNLTLGGLVTIFTGFGIIPYIALQIKAISSSFSLIASQNELIDGELAEKSLLNDTSFYITMTLALFVILFGTMKIEATERHEGLVSAIVFESVFKVIAFVLLGVFLTYSIFDGPADIFQQASVQDGLSKLFTVKSEGYGRWFWMLILSMSAILFLPRQFQVAVIENVNEKHLLKAAWLFPLYLLVINLFVLPIALGGNIIFSGMGVNADNYVLAIPMHFDNGVLALLVFLGGLSAATSMVIVSTISLSVMFSNNLILPILVSTKYFKTSIQSHITSFTLWLRRFNIIVVLLLAFAYYKWVAHDIALVSIGLISFAAMAQFVPVVIGGIFWKGGTRQGALFGLSSGILVWFYTLVTPSIVEAGFLPESLMSNGLFGIELLMPNALFGLNSMDPIVHGTFWSLSINLFLYLIVSVNTRQSSTERNQAEIFVDIFKYSTVIESSIVWKGKAYIQDLYKLLANFIGQPKAQHFLQSFAERNKIDAMENNEADPRVVNYAESLLAGSIGVASARILISSVVKEEEITMTDVFGILKESQELIAVNRELKEKSIELKRATEDLRKAYDQLQKLDHQKDEFISTVTHEMRTPLTSIRSFSEILKDNDDLKEQDKQQFLDTIIKEADRMERLISQVLDIEKIQSGKVKLDKSWFSINDLIKESAASMGQLIANKDIKITFQLQDTIHDIKADKDRIYQVILNLLSNAIKFGIPDGGELVIGSYFVNGDVKVSVKDNGKGIDKENQEFLFDPFFQANNQTSKKPKGSGLGLAICKRIIELHKGKIWVETEIGKGAKFIFLLPKATSRMPIEQIESKITVNES